MAFKRMTLILKVCFENEVKHVDSVLWPHDGQDALLRSRKTRRYLCFSP